MIFFLEFVSIDFNVRKWLGSIKEKKNIKRLSKCIIYISIIKEQRNLTALLKIRLNINRQKEENYVFHYI